MRKIVAVALFFALAPLVGVASLAETPLDARPAGDADSQQGAARDAVVAHLIEQGLDRAAAESRLSEMSEEDVLHFSQHPQQIRAAGAVPDYIWILLAVFLGVLILSAIF